ncbi:MAG: hypothetical protein V4450_04130 [Bacteroidota bacterium]
MVFLFSPAYPKVLPQQWLLDNTFTRTLDKFLTPDILVAAAQVLMIAIAIVVAVIYLYLFNKKQRFFYTNRIRKLLENWISEIIMEETEASRTVSKKIQRILRNRTAKQFAINELILCKKNFSGVVSENIVSLYLELGLKAFSLNKLRKKNKWHIKAKGIQELYLMDQKDTLTTIYRNTNSKNEMVRMEAQTGVIHLTGFKGLRFLDVISYPLTEWQQLKLLEQLRLYAEKEDLSDKIPKWLLSKNTSVVVFALKLADDYQVFSVRTQVVNCLVHPEKKVRSQAIETIIRLADEKTPAILLGYFAKESLPNQIGMLDALRTMATNNETSFLTELLYHENDTVKLKAAIVLAENTDNGMALIEQKALTQPEPYQRIYRHIKTVK